jgi:hypothetical protein
MAGTLHLLKALLLKGVTHFTRVGETFPRGIEEATDEELRAMAVQYTGRSA